MFYRLSEVRKGQDPFLDSNYGIMLDIVFSAIVTHKNLDNLTRIWWTVREYLAVPNEKQLEEDLNAEWNIWA